MKLLLLSMLLLGFTTFLFAEDEQITTIFNETKKEIANIIGDKVSTDKEKLQQIDLCKKKNLNRLETLNSFYIDRMKFAEAKQVKEAIVKFKENNFTNSEKSNPKEITKTPEKKDTENKATNSESQKGGSSYLEKKKEGVTALEYLALPQDKKDQYIKKFVTKDADGYFSVNKGKYTVKSDISEGYTMEKAIFMDDFYIAFERIFFRGFADNTSPTLQISRSRTGYFEALRKKGINAPPWSGGLYYSSKRLLAAFNEVGDEELMKVMLHEGTHQLLDYYTKKDLLPWFNEGTATNFETWDIYKTPKVNLFESQFKSCWLEHVAEHQKNKKYTLTDFKFLLNISYENWNDSDDPSDYYAQGWSMINFLMNTPENFKNYDRILVGFMKNEKINKIFTEKEIDELGKQWIDDLNNRIVPMHKHGKEVYAAIQEWLKTKSYNKVAMKEEVYQLNKESSLQATEFKYLKAMHKMIMGETKEALDDLQSLVKLNDDLPSLYSAIAFCQNQNNLKEECKKSLALAFQKDGNDLLARSLQ